MREGTHHAPSSIAKLREAGRREQARRKRLAKVAPAEVRALERGKAIASPTLRLCAQRATEELAAWLDSLGGPDHVSPQRRSIAENASRISLLIHALVAQWLSGDADPELASRIGTLVGVHRASLVALGLDRVEHEVGDLRTYLATRSNQNASSSAPRKANGADVGPSADTDEIAPEIEAETLADA